MILTLKMLLVVHLKTSKTPIEIPLKHRQYKSLYFQKSVVGGLQR